MIGRILLLAGAASLVPGGAGLPAAAAGQDGEPAVQFLPPHAPMVLTRTVWRNLGDGKQIVVTRRYAISFAARGDGFLLDGRLLDAAVSVPEALQAMAEQERRRTDAGMFPIRLDARGRIEPGPPAAARDPANRQAALFEGEKIIDSSPVSAERRREGAALLAQLAMQGIGGAWPSDLFNPRGPRSHEQRQVALPDGQTGEVEVTVTVGALLPCGLPQAVERTVVTRLAETERVSRERWTLAPAGTP